MKKITVLISIVLINLSLFAQQKTGKQSNRDVAETKLANNSDTLQYALGAFIGQWMLKNNFEVKNASIFLKGMDDALQKKNLAITDSSIAPIVSAYQLSNQNIKSRQMEEQLFASLKGKSGVGALPNGVHYMIRKQGTGKRPVIKDTVVFHAVGVFPDGKVFEDTYKKNQALTAVLGNLIPGLYEAMQLMPAGSVWRIFIPSVHGYGPAGLPNLIPANSALVFDIELLEIK